MTTPPTIHAHVLVHCRWFVAVSGARLDEAIVARLAPYITRYAQTLGVGVSAVGGASDHLHILLILPPDQTLARITDELQAATTRLLAGTLALRDFAWADVVEAESVGPESADLAAYITGNAAHHADGTTVAAWETNAPVVPDPKPADARPPWLREAMGDAG